MPSAAARRFVSTATIRLGAALVPLTLLLASQAAWAGPEGPRLGRPIPAETLAERSIHVFPDGTGLPPGRGTAEQGRPLYREHCAGCHGAEGQGGSAGELAGGGSLTGPNPDKNIGTYWPYATTVFDFVRRSMPLHAPRRLRDDQVYAITAYLLFLNGLVEESMVIDAATLPAVRMPNRDGFISQWPESGGAKR